MGKLRRPKKGSIHEIPLYDGTEPAEPPEDVKATLEALRLAVKQDSHLTDPKKALEAIEHFRTVPREKAVAISTNDELEGVRAGLVYVGPKKAQRWSQKETGLKIVNAKALGEERKHFTKKEWVPELYDAGTLSPESLAMYRELLAEVFHEGVAYLEGVEGLEVADYEQAKAEGEKAAEAFALEVVDFLEELDFGEQLKLMARVVALQSLRRSQTFPSACARVLEADGPSVS